MSRVFNFAPGPATLPEEVLRQVQSEFLEYGETGLSIVEMSHRSKDFDAIIESAEQTLRRIMSIPESYRVLFLQGGASTQFAMVPMNLFTSSGSADYMNTGSWAQKAIAEAGRYGRVEVVATSEDTNFSAIPDPAEAGFHSDADYAHITMNNTIFGTRFPEIPHTGSVPLVADVSSCVLSEPIDVSRFGLLYAGAQKNIGPAGLTIVIIREELIGNCLPATPTMLRYDTHAAKQSRFNTPPSFCIYVAALVFRWIEDNGGVSGMGSRNREKAALLYDYIDNSRFFHGTAALRDRSLMNVTFLLPTDELTARFVEEAGARGLVSLKGHRSVGGLRASLYNAMPLEGVQALVDFMDRFEKKHA